MKRYALLFIFSGLILSNFAQQAPAAFALDEQFNLWNFQKSDTAYIFAEVAYIRDSPNLQSQVIDSLTHGSSVVISSEAYSGTIVRGFYAPWHEITYVKDTHVQNGYIWLGLLALNGTSNQNEDTFIYGLKKFHPSSDYSSQYYESELKIFDKHEKLIAKESFQADIDGQTGVQTKLLPAMGLKNISNIHRITFLSEACGIPTLYYYFAWNGTTLIRFPDRMNLSDAGVFFIEESILFPAEHQEDPSTILKNKIVGENIANDPETPRFEESFSQQIYSWDGHQLREIITMQ